jgi:hypothetical protein
MRFVHALQPLQVAGLLQFAGTGLGALIFAAIAVYKMHAEHNIKFLL